jgi:hypothetical protein
MRNTLLALFLAVTLAGCGTLSGTKLAAVTEADADAAIAEATTGNDPQGVLCWTAVKTFIATGGTTVQLKGVFSDIEAARLLRRHIQMGTPAGEAVHNACSPLVTDANVTLVKLGLVAGGL